MSDDLPSAKFVPRAPQRAMAEAAPALVGRVLGGTTQQLAERRRGGVGTGRHRAGRPWRHATTAHHDIARQLEQQSFGPHEATSTPNFPSFRVWNVTSTTQVRFLPAVRMRLLEIQEAIGRWDPADTVNPQWHSRVTPEHEGRRVLCRLEDLAGEQRLFDLHARFTPGPMRLHLRWAAPSERPASRTSGAS